VRIKENFMIHIQPAYNRHYLTYADAKNDWEAGKDFKILGGPYCSKRDEEQMLDYYDEVVVILSTGQQHTLAERKRALIDEVLGK
jgi:hypothetical protein